MGLLLALMNKLVRADRQVREGRWVREDNRGTEIRGKTVGILGYGNMGQAFARRLSGFGAEVIAYDKFKTDYGDEFAEAVSLDALFQRSDILSVHIPYTPENEYFINAAFIDRFHKPIWLVNTARGKVLHTFDLVAKLKDGKVPGAALDVLEYEDGSFTALRADNNPAPLQYLINSGQVILSPHIAGWSHESRLKHAQVLADKIEQHFGEKNAS